MNAEPVLTEDTTPPPFFTRVVDLFAFVLTLALIGLTKLRCANREAIKDYLRETLGLIRCADENVSIAFVDPKEWDGKKEEWLLIERPHLRRRFRAKAKEAGCQIPFHHTMCFLCFPPRMRHKL